MSGGRYRHGIGVIAGLGPAAGAYFYSCLVDATPGDDDQDHPEVVLVADPRIPSRLRHLAGAGPDPAPALRETARRLRNAGCGVIVLTSITTHAYFDAIGDAVDVPVVDARTAVAAALAAMGMRRPALVVTTPARSLGMLEPTLRREGISPCYPGASGQAGIDAVVAMVKAGCRPVEAATFLQAELGKSWVQASDGILVGCTDLALLTGHLTVPVQDVTRILARAALAAAR